MTDSADLAKNTTIVELIAAFHRATDVVRQSFAALAKAERDVNLVFSLGERSGIGIRPSERDHVDWSDPTRCLARMERDAWYVIVCRLEIRRILSVARATELDQRLEKGALPPLTVENVHAFAKGYAEQLHEMHAEAVREVYDWLRPHDWTDAGKLKTNQHVELGRKMILDHMVEEEWGGTRFRLSYGHASTRVLALERVCRALDGKGMVSPGHEGDLQVALRAAGPSGAGETELFVFKCFKNKRLHLAWKRLDLLKRLNEIAGGLNLKPPGENAPAPEGAMALHREVG